MAPRADDACSASKLLFSDANQPEAAWVADSSAPVFATFLTLQYVHRSAVGNASHPFCENALIGLMHWTAQVYTLADALSQDMHERFAIHLESDCLDRTFGKPLTRMFARAFPSDSFRRTSRETKHVEVITSSGPPRGLREAISGLRWRSALRTLQKWDAMAMTHSQLVIFLDMDVEVFPLMSVLSRPERQVRVRVRVRGAGATYHVLP